MTERFETDNQTGRVTTDYDGRLAQLVERTLSMREVGGSKPPLSKIIQISIVQQFKFKKEFF